jgi:opacity protein-like surface antigen
MRQLVTLVCLTSSLALAQSAAAPAEEPPSNAFGVVFNLQNVFQSSALLTGFNGGVGVQFGVSDRVAIRPSLSLSRTSTPAVITESTTVAGGMTTTTRTLRAPTGPTSTFGLGLAGDVLYALLDKALTPYLGGGLFVSFASSARSFRDDTMMDQVTTVNDTASAFGFGLRGLLGVRWRVHPNFALFAEYSLGITIFSSDTVNTSTERTVMGETTSLKTNSTTPSVFELSTGLSQGAALGVVAYF